MIPKVYAAANTNFGPPPAGPQQFQELIVRVISISVGLAFIVLTVMLVYAGIKYITSQGEAKALQSAQQTVTWSILGILFLALSWLILVLIKTFTGVDVTTFCLYQCT